jgi:hypothetical protein
MLNEPSLQIAVTPGGTLLAGHVLPEPPIVVVVVDGPIVVVVAVTDRCIGTFNVTFALTIVTLRSALS